MGAITDFDKSLLLRPDHPLTLNNRAYTKRKSGDLEGALQDLNTGLILEPLNVFMLNNRAITKHLLGNREQALLDLNLALTLHLEEPDAGYNTACANSLLGHFEIALDWLAQAISKDKKFLAMARTDSDFDDIRDDPRFMALVGEGEQP